MELVATESVTSTKLTDSVPLSVMVHEVVGVELTKVITLPLVPVSVNTPLIVCVVLAVKVSCLFDVVHVKLLKVELPVITHVVVVSKVTVFAPEV